MQASDLRKIGVRQLRIGMYVHEFCGSWMDHPFWRSKFVVRTQAEIDKVLASGVQALWIDTGKGLDVVGGQSPAEAAAAVERALEFVASQPWEAETGGDGEDAVARAEALYRRTVPRIASMFSEVRLGRAVDSGACEAMVDEITDSVLRNPGALISVARLKCRDDYTYMHSVAVCALMVALGRQLGLSGEQLRQAGLAGMLHDVGKAMVPAEILNKPGALSDSEFAVMRTHPARGYALLLEGDGAGPIALDVCLHHHEKIDGSGYPERLSGDRISLFAKMAAVCDVYDAVTSNRPYKAGWDPAEALRRMAQWNGHFEPRVFQSFVKTVGIYPVGSLVRLASGRLAVVFEQNPASLLAPRVKAFFSTKSNLRIVPEDVDLASHGCHDKIVGCESPSEWPFQDLDRLWNAAAMPALAP